MHMTMALVVGVVAVAAFGGGARDATGAGTDTGAGAGQGREFRSAAEARAWLTSEQLGTDPDQLLIHLSFDDVRSVEVMRAYVALGLPVNGPAFASRLRPLTIVTRSCVGNASAAQTTAVLIAAGADPTLPATDGQKMTALMEAVNCPDVLRAMLARPVDLSAVDPRGYTLMHHALASSEARTEAVRIVREAGFDVARWRASLNKEFRYHTDLADLLDGPSASMPGIPSAPAADVDWTAVGPYPARSAAEAARLLSRPGADVSVDDHLWDAIARRQPQRLALALQAGAKIGQVSRGSEYTPLMTLAERCDGTQPDLQLSLAEQLIAAKADTTTLSRNGSNALMMGAARCPIAVVRALVAAGSPVSAVDTNGNTAMKLAILEGRADVVALLIDAGVDPRKEPYNAVRMASGNKAVQDALRRRPTP